jgi:membrane-bound serine protease (ClpP class)
MEFLLDPNVAYLVLLAGLMMGFLALVTPGTGFFEVGAVFCIVLAGYAVSQLSFNIWGVVLLILSVAPFIYAIRKRGREVFVGLSILLLVLGSVFIFPSPNRLFAVNPLLALMASVFVAGFLWVAVRKSLDALQARPTHDLDALIGQIGEARNVIGEEGSVQVAGELWSARSADSIPAGSKVRVLRRDGFVVIVEQVQA